MRISLFFYSKELPPELFNAPIVTAAAAAEGIAESERGNMKVFDVAAGTGLCGLQVLLKNTEFESASRRSTIIEPRYEKTGFLHMRKQRRRSASQ